MMKIKQITLLTWLICLLVMNACIVPKKRLYINDMQLDTAYNALQMPPLALQKNDRIQIVVSASSPELAAPFNGGVGGYRIGDEGNVINTIDRTLSTDGYLIDRDGNIDFPILGKTYVEGMTLEAVRDLIRRQLIDKQYINNPTVKVELLNLKVSVIGAVADETVLSVPEAKITLLDAIVKAGGLSPGADPKKIYVIREEYGERVKYVNDIESVKFFDSPTYYLQQNDIVYVEPKSAVNTPREDQNMRYIGYGTMFISLALSVITLLKL